MWINRRFSPPQLRLTILYGTIWFGVLLAGLVFCRFVLDARDQANRTAWLASDWSTLKGYLRVQGGIPLWFYDHDDPDETATVSRLKRRVILTDSHGNLVARGPQATYLEGRAIQALIGDRSARALTQPGHSATQYDRGNRVMFTYGQIEDLYAPGQFGWAFIGRPVGHEPLAFRLLHNWPFLLLMVAILSLGLNGLLVRHCIAATRR